jgi:PucR-like helix-turn-helix protein
VTVSVKNFVTVENCVTAQSDLAARIAHRLPGLRPLIVQRLTQVPSFGRLPPGVLQADITEVVMANLHLFAQLLLDEREVTEADLHHQIRSAERRAEEKIPLHDALTAYHVGFNACWDELSSLLQNGDDVEEIALFVRSGLRFLQAVTSAVADAYVETSTSLRSREQEARRVLLDLALTGQDEEEHWLAASLTPWSIRTIVHLRHTAPEFDDPMTATIEGRRLARRTRQALTEMAGAEVLDALTPQGGPVLIAGGLDRDPLTQALSQALPTAWWCGLATVTDTGSLAMRDASQGAKDCADLAQRLGLASGIYVVPELMVELQVTRPGPARDALTALLVPLHHHPEMQSTLATYLALDGSRNGTAHELHVHPNTLDNRLRRIRELTGVDVTDRAGFQVARAAWTASTFVAGRPPETM